MHPLRELTETELRGRTSVKWSQYPEDVLPLWIAEMDARPAAVVTDALQDLVTRGDAGYGVVGHCLDAFAGFARRRWGWAVAEDAGVELADVLTGLATAIRLATAPGAPVVLNPPVYPPFYEVVEWAERRVALAPLGADGRLDLDRLDSVLAELGPGACYLLCSPHNPTGTVHTRVELEAVAQVAAEREARLIVDEIHAPLAPRGFVPFLTVEGGGRGFVATSASKAFNLAGLKAGMLLAGPDAVHELAAIPPVVTFGASQFGLIAQTAPSPVRMRGSTRWWATWRTTGGCCAICWTSTFPPSAGRAARGVIWTGSTSGISSVRTLPSRSWSVDGSR